MEKKTLRDLTTEEIRMRIDALSEQKYRAFCERISHSALPIRGVRLPLLRAFAKELTDETARALLAAKHQSTEEQTLCGFWIGRAKLSAEARIEALERLMEETDTWSVCDPTAAAQKDMKRVDLYREAWDRWTADRREYVARFAVVCTLSYGLTEEEIDRSLERLARATFPSVAVRTARAWAYATASAKFPVKTLEALDEAPLDDFTARKIRSKSRESHRISQETLDRTDETLARRGYCFLRKS